MQYFFLCQKYVIALLALTIENLNPSVVKTAPSFGVVLISLGFFLLPSQSPGRDDMCISGSWSFLVVIYGVAWHWGLIDFSQKKLNVLFQVIWLSVRVVTSEGSAIFSNQPFFKVPSDIRRMFGFPKTFVRWPKCFPRRWASTLYNRIYESYLAVHVVKTHF